MNGRLYKAHGANAHAVGVLTLSPVGLQLEMQCRATLYFGWPKYADFCRNYLSRTEWGAIDVALMAATLAEIAASVGLDELGRRAARSSKHWHIPVTHYVTVWGSLTAFFRRAADAKVSIVVEPIPDGRAEQIFVTLEPALETAIDSTLNNDIDTFKRLLDYLPDTRETVLGVVQENKDLLFDFENAFLDVFQAADTSLRVKLTSLVGEMLRDASEQVVLFGLQVAQSSTLQAALERHHGYRTSRQLHRLSKSRSLGVRQSAELASETYIEDGFRQLRAVARGYVGTLSEADWRTILIALEEAQGWFAETMLTDPKDIPELPGWTYIQYAHTLLSADGPPHFPVPLETLCDQLGIALVRSKFRGDFDGVLVQIRGLPGPVIIINTAQCSGYRERFTIAHEIAHAILPWHANRLLDLPKVEETTSIRPQDVNARRSDPLAISVEKEADKFAAYLLMPPKWFGPDARKVPFSLDGLTDLQAKYGVSLSAAAFNAIHHTRDAVALIYTTNGRCRYRGMSDEFRQIVGADAELHTRPGTATGAKELLANQAATGSRLSRTVSASAWLSGRSSVEYLRESSVATFEGHVLTILEPEGEEW